MKSFYACLTLAGLITCLFSCHSKLAAGHGTGKNLPLHKSGGKKSTNKEFTNDKFMNKEFTNKESTDLLGTNPRESLQRPPFDEWFVKNYNTYKVDTVLAGRLKPRLEGKRFLIFMGTWCGDSRREVPRMYKLLDNCGVNPVDIELVMVSKEDSVYKQSPGHEEKGMNIFRIPDLLVFDKTSGKDFGEQKEWGRIVESPVISLENDLLQICSREKYISRYQGEALLAGLSGEKPSDWEKKLSLLADRIRPLVESPSELKSYAHVLRAAGERERADMVLKLNVLIFPDGK